MASTSCIPGSGVIRSRACTLATSPIHEQRPSKRLIDGAFVLSSYAPRAGAKEGHLLVLREGTLTARPFDPHNADIERRAGVVAEDVPAVDPPAAFSASLTGAVAFSAATSADRSRLVWFDRTGKEFGQLGPPSYGSNISISPDGKQIAFDSIESDRHTRHIWTADPARGVVTLVKTRRGTGRRRHLRMVTWRSSRPGHLSDPAVRHRARRSRSIGLRTPSCRTTGRPMAGFSSSMNSIRPGERSLRASIEQRQPIPLIVTDADEWPAVFSPDGKWIAYSSDETGTREVYVRDFAPERVPAVGSVRMRVSTNGGDKPRWRRDGTELYYISPDRRLMAVPVATDAGV